MTGEERRIALLNTIREANAPISGTSLAKIYHVSRQIIVQDIALLRTQHPEIQATPRGYVMLHAAAADSKEVSEKHTISNSKQTIHKSNGMVQRVYCVTHTDEQIEDELNTIVDMGGIVLDVYVEHKIYGAIRADLTMKCRRHVQEFMQGIRSGQSMPLKNLTSGIHYHTVEAENEAILDMIADELSKKGYLIS